jgi:predicted ATPase with chaperone activity
VARTSADLEASTEIEEHHILEALGFRLQDVAA